MLIGSGPTAFDGADYRLIATPAMALAAAAAFSRAQGVPAEVLGDALQGEAAELGRTMAASALGESGPKLLLSGGETTVTIGAQKPGRGGRNTEFLLSLALALNGAVNIYALAGDTDGIDGTEAAAGAIITPDTLTRARAAGLDPAAMLKAHDSYSLFAKVNDLVITGPTLTNVNDIRAILIL
jgi:hydroxypyruvate reductase